MIDSTNLTFPDSLVDYTPTDNTGYPASLAAADTSENLRMMGARDFPDSLWIEPKDWKDVSRELDKLEISAEHRRNRFSNQGGGNGIRGTHECTCHSLIQAMEAAWNAQRKGKGSAVYFSQISVYAEANPGQWGGAGCLQVLRIAQERGALPEHHGPDGANTQKAKFKHTLHGTCGKGNAQNSRGKWTAVRNFPSGWKDTARHFRPLEVIEPDDAEQAVCLMLHSRIINVGRSGHAVPWNRVVWRGGRSNDPFSGLHAAYPDSYDVIRYDSWSTMRRAIGGASCIFTITTPDDWDRPAGEDMRVEA